MAFVVEDGSGLVNANAYIEPTYADEYHSDRANTTWSTQTLAQKRAAIVKATFYVDGRFSTRFRGYKRTAHQARQWPRTGAYDSNSYEFTNIPEQLKAAIAEYALIVAVDGEIAPSPESGDNSGALIGSKRKLGPIVIEKMYQVDGSFSAGGTSLVPGSVYPIYPQADSLLEELLRSSTTVEMVRA